jgi:hypothetical protein
VWFLFCGILEPGNECLNRIRAPARCAVLQKVNGFLQIPTIADTDSDKVRTAFWIRTAESLGPILTSDAHCAAIGGGEVVRKIPV